MGVPADVAELCRGIHPRLVGALALHCGDRDVAEEVAQEALARTWERWDEVGAMDRPEAWVYRVAFNLAASRFRRRAAERRARARAGPDDVIAREPDGADVLAVRAAIAALPDRQRATIVLRWYADLSVDETAAALGCASGTVKSSTSQAMATLRRLLDVDLDVEVVDA